MNIIDKEFTQFVKEINTIISQTVKDFSNLEINLIIEKIHKNSDCEIALDVESISRNTYLTKKIAEDIVVVMQRVIGYHFDEFDRVTMRKLNNCIEDISIGLLFNVNSLESYDYEKVYKFIKYLETLSVKTYETEPICLGMFIVDNINDAKEKLSILNIKWSPFEKEMNIEELIKKEKPLIKLIDNKSVALVLNKDFCVIGFAIKDSKKKSIEDIILGNYFKIEYDLFEHYAMNWVKELVSKSYTSEDIIKKMMIKSETLIPNNTDDDTEEAKKQFTTALSTLDTFREEFYQKMINYINEFHIEANDHIKYIKIINSEIQWYLSNNYILTTKNGKWKLKHFILLSSYIFEYLHMEYLALNTIFTEPEDLFIYVRHEISKVAKLISNIRQMSENNVGGLFIILKTNSEEEEITKNNVCNYIPDQMVEVYNDTYNYKSIIFDDDGHCMSIDKIDKYLLLLIAGVDGATILDNKLNILSFGEIIKNENIDIKNKSFGARTNAAISASIYGLAIKVSEDGDIELFKDKKLIFKM